VQAELATVSQSLLTIQEEVIRMNAQVCHTLSQSFFFVFFGGC
jgi:hypothetical protein